MKNGEKVAVSPELTGLKDWVEGAIIDIEKNKFNGIVIAIKTSDGVIYFGQEKYFKKN
jgi:hypothetical protein